MTDAGCTEEDWFFLMNTCHVFKMIWLTKRFCLPILCVNDRMKQGQTSQITESVCHKGRKIMGYKTDSGYGIPKSR